MGKMNNIFHYLDLKISALAILIASITTSQLDVSIKIIGGLIFIGYTIHRWYLMVKEHKNKK